MKTRESLVKEKLIDDMNLIVSCGDQARPRLVEGWIALMKEVDPAHLPNDFVVSLNQMIRAHTKNMEPLVSHKDFFEVVQKIPHHALIRVNMIAHNLYKKMQSKNHEWVYQKVIIDLASEIKKTSSPYFLSEKINDEYKAIALKSKQPYSDMLHLICRLYGSIGSSKDRQIVFGYLKDLAKQHKLPAVYYLVAIHQFANQDLLDSVNYFYFSYNHTNKKINENPKNNDLIIFRDQIIDDLEYCLNNAENSQNKYATAIVLNTILIENGNYKKCRNYLECMSKTSENDKKRYGPREEELYFKLFEKSHDLSDLDRSAELGYGPALLKKAKTEFDLKHYQEASNYYYRAIYTTKAPEIDNGTDGLKACLKKSKVGKQSTLDGVACFVKLIRNGIRDTAEYGFYKEFLQFLVKEYGYIPAKHALACITKTNQDQVLTSEEHRTKYLLVRYDFMIHKKEKNPEFNLNQELIHLVIQNMSDDLLPAEMKDCQEAIGLAKKELQSSQEKTDDLFLKILILMTLAVIEEKPLQTESFQKAMQLDPEQIIIQTVLETMKAIENLNPLALQNIDVCLAEVLRTLLPIHAHGGLYPDLTQFEHYLSLDSPEAHEPSAPPLEDDNQQSVSESDDLENQQGQINQLIELAKQQQEKITQLIAVAASTEKELRKVGTSIQESELNRRMLEQHNKTLQEENARLRSESEKWQDDLGGEHYYNPFCHFKM